MQSSQTPTPVPLPFAANGTKNEIPEASQISVTPGAASLNDGFPPLTFTPIAAGGVPPAGADFNGILNLITQTIRWMHAGGMLQYNAGFANDSNVGGYPKGALLLKSTLDGLWRSSVENNVTDPDTGGAGWVDALTGRLLNVSTITSSETYNPIDPATQFVIFEGCGAGAGGSGSAATGSGQSSAGCGGAAGSYAVILLRSGFRNLPITIGAAGSAGAANAGGGTGGSTLIGSLATLPGGPGAPAPTASSFLTGNIAGRSATPSFNLPADGKVLKSLPGKAATVSLYGGGNAAISGEGGGCPLGTGGSPAAGQFAGNPGSGSGGGGSGGCTTAPNSSGFAGGAGTQGVVIAWEYA